MAAQSFWHQNDVTPQLYPHPTRQPSHQLPLPLRPMTCNPFPPKVHRTHLEGATPPMLSGPLCISSVVKLGGSSPSGGHSGRLIWSSSSPWGSLPRRTTSRPLSVSNFSSGAGLLHSAVGGCRGGVLHPVCICVAVDTCPVCVAGGVVCLSVCGRLI